MKEEAAIICIRVKDAKEHVDGATIANCAECDERVWLSPSSHNRLVEYECKLLCTHCVPLDAKAEITTDAIIEAIKHWNK